MKLVVSECARRQLEGPGAAIAGVDVNTFQQQVNLRTPVREQPGYAPFCQLRFYENWTNAKCGIVPITPAVQPHIETGYEARRESELPVLVRFLPGRYSPLPARYLCLVLYDRAQMALEGEAIEADFAIVGVLCLLEPVEPPIPPATQMRNALGIAEGGSGVPLDHGQYLAAVAFWSTHVAVRPE